jgi:formate hydrogenlyase subunit 3/multisubunit Na+/H+ antiporter MnhD subunit
VIIVRGGTTSFSWTWIDLGEGVRFDVDLATSTLGMLVYFGSAAFALLITVYALREMADHALAGRFYAYVILSVAGACIVALAGNLLVLLVGWELVTLMLFLLINLGGGRAGAGAAKTYGMLGFADACLLLAVALLIAQPGGAENLSLTRGPIVVGDLGWAGYVSYLLIMVAALAKAGAVPVHTWIPAAAPVTPTPVMALLPAAVDKLLGIYLLAVLSLGMFRPDATMQIVMMTIGGITIIAAVLMAMLQHNLKRLLAFHAVSQVGYMVLGIGTGTTIGVIGGLFHMLNNAIYKSNLFLMSGNVGRAADSDEIADMGGLARALPVTFVCGAISAAAISGVPPFNGFVSKWLVYQGALELDSRALAATFLVVAVFGSALTLASFVKVMHSAFLSPVPERVKPWMSRIHENWLTTAPMIVLAAACVILGLWPQLITQQLLAPALASTVTTGPPVSSVAGELSTGTIGLWNPTQATGLILIGIALGVILLWIATGGRRVRIVRPFIAGEVPQPVGHRDPRRVYDEVGRPERFRVAGTHFYDTISHLPVIGAALKHGEAGAMDAYHWSGRHGKTFVQTLRAQHTGLLNLYVAWVFLGLTVIVVYLLLCMGS